MQEQNAYEISLEKHEQKSHNFREIQIQGGRQIIFKEPVSLNTQEIILSSCSINSNSHIIMDEKTF